MRTPVLFLALLVDEFFITAVWVDDDGDGYGGEQLDWPMCRELEDGLVTSGGDCDDTNPDVGPHAEEVLNGEDDDCDGAIDEDL